MKVIIQKEWFSVEQCEANPNKLYIFGDNSQKHGKGGQAQIRDCVNAFGVATKRAPTMSATGFFYDDPYDLKSMIFDLNTLINIQDYEYIVFPKDGLGTGLSQMPEKSPKLFKLLCEILLIEYRIELTETGFKDD